MPRAGNRPKKLKPPMVMDVLPDLAMAIQEALEDRGEQDLAEQVPTLRIVEPCGCTSSDCASFRTERKPRDGWGATLHDMALFLSPGGSIILDIVDDRIVYIEVLNRPDVKEVLSRIP